MGGQVTEAEIPGAGRHQNHRRGFSKTKEKLTNLRIYGPNPPHESPLRPPAKHCFAQNLHKGYFRRAAFRADVQNSTI